MIKKTQKVFEYELPIKIKTQKEGGFLASCSSWSDCYAQGESVDQAILEVTAIAQSLIEIYKEEGLQIPLKLKSKKSLANPLLMPVIVGS